MVRKVKKKTSGIGVLVRLLLLAGAVVFGLLPPSFHPTYEPASRWVNLLQYDVQELGSPKIKGGEILGGKTGYTDEAGLCLASLAKAGKQEYILITAGAKGDHQSEQYNIIDALTVYNNIGKE